MEGDAGSLDDLVLTFTLDFQLAFIHYLGAPGILRRPVYIIYPDPPRLPK